MAKMKKVIVIKSRSFVIPFHLSSQIGIDPDFINENINNFKHCVENIDDFKRQDFMVKRIFIIHYFKDLLS
jgi:hypothetical protein